MASFYSPTFREYSEPRELVGSDSVIRPIVAPVIYALLRARGTAYTPKDEPVRFDAVVIAPSRPPPSGRDSSGSIYCQAWLMWFASKAMRWREELEGLASAGTYYECIRGENKQDYCLVSALHAEAPFDVSTVGSLYLTEDLFERLSSKLEFREFLEVLGRHLDEDYKSWSSLGEAVDSTLSSLPEGWEAESSNIGREADLAAGRAVRGLATLQRDWLVLVESYEGMRIWKRALLGGKEYRAIAMREVLNSLARNYFLSRLEAEYKAYSMLENYYSSMAGHAEALAGSARASGDFIAGSYFESEAAYRARAALEARAMKEKVLQEYNEMLRKLERFKIIQVPLVIDPETVEISISYIVFPLIVGLRLRGLKAEGVHRRVALTPDGVGIVKLGSGAFLPYLTYNINTYLGLNDVAREEPVTCAYGDCLISRSTYTEGVNRCSVCGAPVCPEHRRIVTRKILFIKRRKTYCPEHVPPKARWTNVLD